MNIVFLQSHISKELLINSWIFGARAPITAAISSIASIAKDTKEYVDYSKNWLSFIAKARELEQRDKKNRT